MTKKQDTTMFRIEYRQVSGKTGKPAAARQAHMLAPSEKVVREQFGWRYPQGTAIDKIIALAEGAAHPKTYMVPRDKNAPARAGSVTKTKGTGRKGKAAPKTAPAKTPEQVAADQDAIARMNGAPTKRKGAKTAPVTDGPLGEMVAEAAPQIRTNPEDRVEEPAAPVAAKAKKVDEAGERGLAAASEALRAHREKETARKAAQKAAKDAHRAAEKAKADEPKA